MNRETYVQSARCTTWWVRRNPMYLLSAVCMAIGARLYLVHPADPTGDPALIVTTMAILQAYELAVGIILILLHRSRRSPEDEPSLLLVGIVFWTGPMATTTEMIAFHTRLGNELATIACVVTLLEFFLLRRLLGLRISRAGQVLAATSVLLIGVTPMLLGRPGMLDGGNELVLYAAWWLLAGITLLALLCGRTHAAPSDESSKPLRLTHGLGGELAFLSLVLAAAAAHLVGMNHAFLGNMRTFYAAPVFAAISIVAISLLAQRRATKSVWISLTLAPLAAALGTSLDDFAPAFPVDSLPRWFRDPLLTALVLATATVLYGYLQTRWITMLHLTAGLIGAIVLRAVALFPTAGPVAITLPAHQVDLRTMATVALFLTAAYLAAVAWIRRSRAEARAAIFCNLAAVYLLTWERIHADATILALTAGYSAIVLVHLAATRPSIARQVLPIAILTVITILASRDPQLRRLTHIHAAVLFSVLLTVGWIWQWTIYRWAAATLALAAALVVAGQWVGAQRSPLAVVFVACGFLSLVIGTLVSWNKRAILRIVRRGHRPSEPALCLDLTNSAIQADPPEARS